MPHGKIREVIPAPSSEVFALLHDYRRRLEWDTLLQAAYLTDGFEAAGPGAVSVCQGRMHLGGIALKTRYITFRSPDVAAITLVNRPPFFATFAASIRHRDLSATSSLIEYTYHFTARPRWLRFLLHPLMAWLFTWETRKRLRGLRHYFEKHQSSITAKGSPAMRPVS